MMVESFGERRAERKREKERKKSGFASN